MSSSLHILLYAAQEADQRSLQATLNDAGYAAQVVDIANQDAFFDQLSGATATYDIAVFCPGAPQWEALSSLIERLHRGADIPWIVVCDPLGEERAVELMREGAADIVLRTEVHRLNAAIAAASQRHVSRVAGRQPAGIARQFGDLLLQAFANLQEALFLVDLETNQITGCNDAAIKLFGYTREELLHRSLGALHHDQASFAAFTARRDEVVAVGQSLREERRMKRKDGGAILASYSSTLFPHQGSPDSASVRSLSPGQGAFTIDVVRPLTRDESDSYAPVPTEQIYRQIVENVQEGICQIDQSAHTTFANAQLHRLLGYEPGELLDRNIADFYLAPMLEQRIARALEQRRSGHSESGEGLFLRKDGSTLWMLYGVSPYFDENNRSAGAIGTFIDISERKRAEEALRDSEATLRTLFDSIEEWIVLIDFNLQIRTYNPVAAKSARFLFGGEFQVGRFIHDYVDPAQRDALRKSIVRAFEGERIRFEQTFSVYGQPGTGVWFSMALHPILNSDGRVTAVALTASDITDLKATTASLEHYIRRLEILRQIDLEILETQSPQKIADVALSRLRELIKVHHVSVTIFSNNGTQGTILAISEEANGILYQGQTYLTTPKIIELLLKSQIFIYNNADDSAPPVQSFFVGNMHREHMRTIAILPLIVSGQLLGAVNLADPRLGHLNEERINIAREVAMQLAIALHQAQLYETVQQYARELEQRVQDRTAELSLHRARFQTILEAMNEGVVRISVPDLRTEYVNRSFSALTGQSPQEVVNEPIERWAGALSGPDLKGTFADEIRTTLVQNRIWQGELTLQRGTLGILEVNVTVSTIDRTHGGTLGGVVLIRDITREKALQVQRERFIANASHELRTPVTNLILRLYLMRKRPEQNDKNLNILESTAQHMKVLIEDLLQLSRFERGVVELKPSLVELNTLIHHVVESQSLRAEQKQITLTCDTSGEEILTLADPNRITQVLDNLLTNALNYTPQGGAVRVSATREAHDQAQGVTIAIADTGIGISTMDLGNLFQPFFRVQQTNVQGTGLGLAIAHEIVNLHNGTITVTSQVGQGSTFNIWLPIILPTTEAPALLK